MRGLHRIRMCFAWAVAALAALNVVLAGESDFRVRGLLKLRCFIFVACSAPGCAYEIGRWRIEFRRPACDRRPLHGFGPLLRRTFRSTRSQ